VGLEAAAAAAPPVAARAPLFSMANAPYAVGAGFVGWRAYKAVEGVREKQRKDIKAYGKALKLGKKQSRAQFAATTSLYKKKLMYLPRSKELFASGLAAIAAKPARLSSLRAFRDLLDVHGYEPAPKTASVLEDIFEESFPSAMERGKLLFYASRCGLASEKLKALAADGLDGSQEFLAASQRGLAETAYEKAVKKKGAEAPFAANPAAAAELGLDDAAAAALLEAWNAPPETDTREEWRKELEAVVEAESGPLPDADEVDTTDKFAPDTGKDETMLTCECNECGYTLFIAAGRQQKFFSDAYKCPTCGVGKSKFTISEAPAE